MKKIAFLLLTGYCLMFCQRAISQTMSNTDNVLTLSNTCMNAGVTNGTYNMLMHYASDAGTTTLNLSVTVSMSGGVMTITAPAGTFPTIASTGYWTMTDTYNGDITLSSGSFITYMNWALDNNYVEQFTCVALPIWFNSFTATPSGSTVALHWQTGIEQNISAIEIYRSSTGGTPSYYKIGQMTPTGGGSNYSFTDNNPDASSFYYLRMASSVGLEGIYSSIVHVSCSGCHYTPPTPVNCTYTINGPDHICTVGSPAAYSLSSAVPNYNTIFWSVDQPSVASLHTYPSYDRTKATLLKKTVSGPVVLKATLSGCSNVISKYIVVGTPTPTISVTLDCPNAYVYASNYPGTTGWEWNITDQTTTYSMTVDNTVWGWQGPLVPGDSYDINVFYTNACGNSPYAYLYNIVCDCGACDFEGRAVVLSPNPSTGIVTVDLSPAAAKSTGAVKGQLKTPAVEPGIYQVRVIDVKGVIRKEVNYPGQAKISLDLSGLNNGVYIIQIFDNKMWRSKKVILNK